MNKVQVPNRTYGAHRQVTSQPAPVRFIDKALEQDVIRKMDMQLWQMEILIKKMEQLQRDCETQKKMIKDLKEQIEATCSSTVAKLKEETKEQEKEVKDLRGQVKVLAEQTSLLVRLKDTKEYDFCDRGHRD